MKQFRQLAFGKTGNGSLNARYMQRNERNGVENPEENKRRDEYVF
jgi:hypothetical protein